MQKFWTLISEQLKLCLEIYCPKFLLPSVSGHFVVNINLTCHYVKSLQIRSFFWSVFSPNAEKYGAEKTPYLGTFHAVYPFIFWSNLQRTLVFDMFNTLKEKSFEDRKFGGLAVFDRFLESLCPQSFSKFVIHEKLCP